jgi:serine protease
MKLPTARAFHLFPGAVALTLALTGLSVTAQPSEPIKPAASGPDKPGRVATQAVGPVDPPSHNRLVIKFRTPATTLAGVFDHRAAEDRVAALAASQRAQAPMAQGMRRIKSVSVHTHVAQLDQPHSRTELRALARQLARDPDVDYVEIDELARPLFTPQNQEGYTVNQWHLKAASGVDVGAANLPTAWDTVRGNGVVVAVIDTGYRPHGDLNTNLLPGYDFVTFATANTNGGGLGGNGLDPGDWEAAGQCATSSRARDSSWHGTHVAGTIAGVNNTIGGVGVAFQAKILPVRALGTCGGFGSDIAAAMRWSAGLPVPNAPLNPNPAKVLNLSLGGPGPCTQVYQDAVDAVRAAGSAVVAATGNDGVNTIGRPANCVGVIAVTAHTRLGDNADYADLGVGTTLSGPGGGKGFVVAGAGEAIYSTMNLGKQAPGAEGYSQLVGTSMAAPHVSGVLALLKSRDPRLTPDQLASVVSNSARAFPAGSYCVGRSECGAGMLDATRAVASLDAGEPFATARVGPGAANAVRLVGSTVLLTGQATSPPPSQPVFSYRWTQLSGPSVTLDGAATASAAFVAPPTAGTFFFEFKATEIGSGKVATSRVSVATNTAPVMAAIAAQSATEGQALSFTATASDAEGDPVNFVTPSLPAGATLDAATGIFDWPAAGPAGNYSVTIVPTDGKNSGVEQTVAITVGPPPASSGGGGAVGWWDGLGLLGLATLALLSRRRQAAKP